LHKRWGAIPALYLDGRDLNEDSKKTVICKR